MALATKYLIIQIISEQKGERRIHIICQEEISKGKIGEIENKICNAEQTNTGCEMWIWNRMWRLRRKNRGETVK